MKMYTDLHCHLGGSTSPHVLKSIAYDRGIVINPKNYKKFYNLITKGKEENSTEDDAKFLNYLDRYKLIQRIASSPDAIRESVYEVMKDAYVNGNVDLLELKINPALRNEAGVYDLDSIISAACDGIKKATSIFGMKGGIIIESDRSFSPELTNILFKKAIKFRDMGVIGIDISGYCKKSFDLYHHIESIKYAKYNGLGITLHTNEIQNELNIYDPEIIKNIDRIGHGVKILSVGSQIETILNLNEDIVFELCPNSNINSGVETLSSIKAIYEMVLKYKVKYTVCSDGFIFNDHSCKNYDLIVENYDEIQKNIIDSHNYSFCNGYHRK